MSKYIIKNCPSYYVGLCTAKEVYVPGCSQCTDCVVKQVIEKCKHCYDEVDKENDGFYSILQLFNVEEILG